MSEEEIISCLVAKGRAAQKQVENYTQEQIDKVCLAVGWQVYKDDNIAVCAKVAAVIPIYQEDNLIQNSAKMGKYLLDRALELKEKHPSVGDVRGLGLFVGLELVKNKKTREPIIPVDAKIRPGLNPKLEVARKLGELGMMAMAANPGNVIAMAPALIVTKDEIDEGISIMDKALEAADAHTEK